MRIIYMGTPDFAVPALEALSTAGYDIAMVVSNPDRPRDRGKCVQCCPVKSFAQSRGLAVRTPDTVRNNEPFFSEIRSLKPDVIVVAAYGKILPKELLEIPRLGCINIHASLLPLYRGAAPIHRAVIDGCLETGVTLMYMEEQMDAGDIIATSTTEIGEKTTEDLFDELAHLGAALLIRELPAILNGTAARIPQDHRMATYAPMVTKQEARIDFSRDAGQIGALVRGMYAWPCAWTCYRDESMKVLATASGTMESDAEPGTILRTDEGGILVACGGGSIALTRIQMPGRRAMDAGTYLLGNKIELGTVLR